MEREQSRHLSAKVVVGLKEGDRQSVTHHRHVQTHLMLSAFHARKARLAAAPGVQEPTTAFPTPTNPDLQSPTSNSTTRRSSRKRKPDSVTGNEAERRRKKTDDRKIEGKIRYFDTPADAPESDLDCLMDEDIASSDKEILSQPHVQPRRAWSPSQPLLDSSDEEVETEVGGVQAANASIDAPTTAPFFAEIGVNTFRLTPEECFALINIEQTAIVTLLPVHSNITFIGVYQLTVLQGAVMVMGVTLVPSNTSHAVFSPRLSPLPRIESLGSTDPASPLISSMPERLQPISSDHAVVLIRAHPTGIEGLGRVMRTFETMFQPSQLAADLGIPGVHVHMVCTSFHLSEQQKKY